MLIYKNKKKIKKEEKFKNKKITPKRRKILKK